MITVKISTNNEGAITKIDASGHAGYDVAGKDIVCAAVSTAVQLTILTLQNLIGDHVEVAEDDDGITIDVGMHGNDRSVMCAMLGFLEFTNSLQASFPANVKVHLSTTNLWRCEQCR